MSPPVERWTTLPGRACSSAKAKCIRRRLYLGEARLRIEVRRNEHEDCPGSLKCRHERSGLANIRTCEIANPFLSDSKESDRRCSGVDFEEHYMFANPKFLVQPFPSSFEWTRRILRHPELHSLRRRTLHCVLNRYSLDAAPNRTEPRNQRREGTM